MPDLNFEIKTTAELAGAQQTATALEMQIGKAKALGQNYSDLQGQLDRVNASLKEVSPELKKLGDKETEAASAAEILHHNHRVLHGILGQLPEPAEKAGMALLNLARGPFGPVLALVGVIGYLKKSFDENAEAMEKAGEEAANGEFKSGIEAMNSALDEGRSKLEDYAAKIGEIAKHEVTIAQALASQLAQMHAIAAARESEAKSHEAAAAAEIKRQQAAGQLSPEQATIAETAAAVQAAKAEAKRKKDEADKEVSDKQGALDKAGLNQSGLDQAAKAKSEQVAREKSHRDSLEKDFGGTREEQEERFKKYREATGVKTVDEAEEELRRRQNVLRTVNPNDRAEYQKQVDEAQADLAKAQAAQQNFQKGRNQYNATQTPEAKSKFEADQRAAAEAAKKGEENATEVERLRRELNDARATAAKTGPINDQALADRIAAILSDAVTKLYSQPRGGEVETGVKIAVEIEKAIKAAQLGNQFQTTGKLSEEEARFLMKFVNEHGGNASTAQGAADYAVKNFGKEEAHTTTDINNQNLNQFSQAEQYLIQLANNLGAHVKNVKDAADFVAKLKDDTSAFFDAVIKLVSNGFTAQQKKLDRLAAQINAGT